MIVFERAESDREFRFVMTRPDSGGVIGGSGNRAERQAANSRKLRRASGFQRLYISIAISLTTPPPKTCEPRGGRPVGIPGFTRGWPRGAFKIRLKTTGFSRSSPTC